MGCGRRRAIGEKASSPLKEIRSCSEGGRPFIIVLVAEARSHKPMLHITLGTSIYAKLPSCSACGPIPYDRKTPRRIPTVGAELFTELLFSIAKKTKHEKAPLKRPSRAASGPRLGHKQFTKPLLGATPFLQTVFQLETAKELAAQN